MIRRLRFFATLAWLTALALGLASNLARAQLTIEIIGGGGTTVPIAIVPFAGEAN
jgi:amino acid permease